MLGPSSTLFNSLKVNLVLAYVSNIEDGFLLKTSILSGLRKVLEVKNYEQRSFD